MVDTCATCVYFNASNSRCQVNAPADLEAGGGTFGVWPRAAASDWCGKFYPGAYGDRIPSTGGSPGSFWTWGSAAPSGGNNGDYYIKLVVDQDKVATFYQKIAGTWTEIIKLTQGLV
jgi:hypothetical protein